MYREYYSIIVVRMVVGIFLYGARWHSVKCSRYCCYWLFTCGS
ncbi:hypothetical protein RUMHYD_00681 [Blautia hydrogenotrophica DSM 10507]|uniref:Uncharacterized protein n=1 Tax=Blautia hydrogenotrophica (strain DSM 10507 / JCM 14656 / S5a33) TaxID=476272 RepID=C0CIL7_BLAHS|nr:hypothetical protein RUMHYD_00681 [Blautia hydrogenotrophica DSM 10507]